MSDEDRKMNLIGSGIGYWPIFTAPPRRSNDAESSQTPDSTPTSKEERAERREYIRQLEEKIIQKREAQEHARAHETSYNAQEAELKRMNDQLVVMYETRTELERFKKICLTQGGKCEPD
jgi:hypothetical protein